MEHGADVNSVIPENHKTPLHLIASLNSKVLSTEKMEGMSDIAQLLLKKGANPNLQDDSGKYVRSFENK